MLMYWFSSEKINFDFMVYADHNNLNNTFINLEKQKF